MRLLLATNNQGKIVQIKETLAGIPWSIVAPEEVGLGHLEIDESGKTLEENARLKARGFFEAAKKLGLIDVAVLADDGGLEIDALNGEPGIYAKRWAGEGATDADIITHTLKRMEGIPSEKRTARFSVAQVLVFCDAREEVVFGTTEGSIVEQASKNRYPGLPYGALLIVNRFGKLYDELSTDEQTFTHRAIALNGIRDIITQNATHYA